MTQEEKAKAYDETLEKARDMLSYKEVRREDMEYLFPELAESEDERMRRELISYFRNNSVSIKWSGLDVKKAIEWLEKQGDNGQGITNQVSRSEVTKISDIDEQMISKIKFAVSQMPSERQDTKKECLNWLEDLRERL